MNRYLEKRMRDKRMTHRDGHHRRHREPEMYEPKWHHYHDYDYYDDYMDGRRDMMEHKKYGGYMEEDYASKGSDEEYHEDLEHWIEKMKHMDRFKVPYEKIIEQAHNMGVKFHDYSEMEFYAVYLAMVTDYKTISGEYSMYLKMARDFLEDDDAKLKGSDKVCAYLYTIVLDE